MLQTEQLKLLDLIALLRKLGEVVDLTHLRDLVDVVVPLFDNEPPFDSAENVEVRIDELLKASSVLVLMTHTDVDDNVYNTIEGLLVDNDLKKPLAGLVFWLLAGNDANERMELIDWKNFDWEAVLSVVQIIVQLIKSLRG